MLRGQHFISLGRGHENLRQTLDVLERNGRSLPQFRAILFVVRNPYDMVASNYHFLRAHFADNQTNPSFQLAARSGFEEFCVRHTAPDTRNWWTLPDGRTLSNQVLLRFEHLETDLADFQAHYQPDQPILRRLRRLNAVPRAPWASLLTPRAEAAIFEKYQPLFEFGGYERALQNAGEDKAQAQ